MRLPEIAIRNPVFAWMLMSALIIFGGISFLRMGVSQLPDVDFPVVSISLSLDGAAPEVIETDVVDIVEDAMMTVEGVTSISSTSKNGRASVVLEFDLNRNIDLALQDVQSKLAQVQRSLPKDLEPPIISKSNPEDQPIMWLGVSSSKAPLRELMLYVRDQLKDQFSTLPGVGDVFLGGYVDPNLRVWVSSEKLRHYELSVSDVIQSIQTEHVESPAGIFEFGAKEFNLRTFGEAKKVEEFNALRINTRGGSPNFAQLKLGQISKIEEGMADIRRISRANGNPAVGLGIRKQRGSNAVDVAHEVKNKIKAITPQLPEGMGLRVNFDGTQFIEDSIHELNFTIVIAAILTALVCLLFLRSWSATLNVILAIPTSIVGTFIVLYFSGFTLNTFTLLALSLSIGIVVDDAIMVLENIVRHNEMGKSRFNAALDGSIEITFAAIAATFSIIAIFLPVAFMKGVIGKFFFQFGVTITVAVLLSLVEALTLTPMRCSQFVTAIAKEGRWTKRAVEFYRRTLEASLRHRWKVLMGALVFSLLSFVIVKWINKEFSPAQDQGRFMVRVQTPVGSSLEFTNEKTKQIEAFLKEQKEVELYYVAIGGFGGGEVNTAVVFITLTPKNKRKASQFDLMAKFRTEFNQIPGVKAVVQDLSLRGFSASRGFPIEFNLRGRDWDVLGSAAEKIEKEMTDSGLMVDVDTDYQLGMPEVQIKPDRTKAAARGVSLSAIGQTINATLGGVVVGKYSSGGHRYDIRLKLEEQDKKYDEQIKSLWVRNNRGELVSLADVVKVEVKPTLQSISRMDRERAVTLFANIKPGVSQQEAMQKAEKIANVQLPEGYRAVFTGSSEGFKDSFKSLLFALILGFVVAYMILASQFNSFVDPFTVLLALPFSFTGAFLTLWITGQSLNIYSMIGLILLMGIVKKNSILLVDFSNQVLERKNGTTQEALLEACPNRLRPIVMTSFSTIMGALPAALALGPGAETRIPMAVAIIGGVLVSTVLTLYVVPSGYSLVARLKNKPIRS